MGQEISVTCPVCKMDKATYKDIFEAEGRWPRKIFGMRQNEEFRLPPFENFLGPDCLKYIYSENPDYRVKENISYWLFYSCEDCINIGDPYRKSKFYIHDPNGVTIWLSQLP